MVTMAKLGSNEVIWRDGTVTVATSARVLDEDISLTQACETYGHVRVPIK